MPPIDTPLADTLLDKASTYLPENGIRLVVDAFRFADEKHEGQTRKSGEPFVEHPLSAALYLADLRLDPRALAAALLHDVVEDCDVEIDELTEKFGPEVSRLVDGVTKLTRTELMPDDGGPGLVDISLLAVVIGSAHQ